MKDIFKWSIDETDINSEVFAISLVDNPAIQEDFVYLSDEKVDINLKEDEKGIIVGPILIPDLLIERKNYFGYFDKEGIEKIANNFMRKKYIHNTELNHKEDVEGVFMLESWIVENEQDKINTKYGYNLPIGTWCGKYFIENEQVREDIKLGKLNGFSISASYLLKLSEEVNETEIDEQQKEIDDLVNNVIDSILDEFIKKIEKEKRK